jgi:hypothetical protein
MAIVSPYLSMVTLNKNGLKFLFKRYGFVLWIKNLRSTYIGAHKRFTLVLRILIG